jgi:hypothetical protein
METLGQLSTYMRQESVDHSGGHHAGNGDCVEDHFCRPFVCMSSFPQKAESEILYVVFMYTALPWTMIVWRRS